LDNFRIDDRGHVRMIDFGIVADYYDHLKKCHYQQCETQFQGTPLTGSIAALQGKNHSRRDDLESLAYTFMHLFDENKITWVNDTTIQDIIMNKKKFLADTNVPLEF
jgi:serine/threonine protein kinase